MKDILNETRAAITRAVEKAAPVAEDVKDKVGVAVENLKEKAAPVADKVKAGVGSAVEAVKDGAEKIGDMLTPDSPSLNVKNELFDELGAQVQQQKAAAMSAAEEMQRKLQELMQNRK